MALLDLTKVDPWGETVNAQREANQRVGQSFQNAANFVSEILAKSQERRQALDLQNKAIRDREYSLINQNTDQLVQPKTGNKITDLQLQQTGQSIKQEYYDAVKTYQNSAKTDEDRAAFEQAKQTALASARTISKSLENLNTATATFRTAYNKGGISDAMDPAVRQFMADLIDQNHEEQFQIQNVDGQLKYVGRTSPTPDNPEGYPVDFFLEDVANGENIFAPIPKADMASVVMNLTKGLKTSKIQEKRDDGSVVSKTNWGALETELDANIDTYLQDENQFRAIAAGEGYGYAEFNAIRDGQNPDIPDLQALKNELRTDLKAKIETILPHEEVVYGPGAPQDLAAEAQAEDTFKQAEQISGETTQLLEQGVQSGDPAAFNQFLNKQIMLQGTKANIHSFDVGKNGQVTIIGRAGNKKVTQTFNTNDTDQLALFQSILTGQDYNLIKQASINSLLLE